MNGTVLDCDLATLRVMAAGDENAGTTAEKIAVIAARARMGELGEQILPAARNSLLGTRAIVAATLEHVDPVGVIADRCDEAAARDDKDEDWGGNPVLTPPPAKP